MGREGDVRLLDRREASCDLVIPRCVSVWDVFYLGAGEGLYTEFGSESERRRFESRCSCQQPDITRRGWYQLETVQEGALGGARDLGCFCYRCYDHRWEQRRRPHP